MSWRDAVALAGRGLLRRPGRVVLTVSAVGLATTLLTALLVIARTAETRVLNELSKGGPLTGIQVVAAEPTPGQLDTDEPRPGPPRDLDENARRQITGLSDVASVVPIVTARVLVIVPPERNPAASAVPVSPFGETYVGTDLRRAGKLPITLLAGRLPGPQTLDEVVVTPTYLERLGIRKDDAQRVVGSELEMGAARVFDDNGVVRFRGRWTRSRVVGVVAQEAAQGEVLGSIEQARLAREWTAASTSDGGGRVDVSRSPYSGLFVVASNLDRVTKVRAAITDVGYATSAPENLIAAVQRYLRVVEIVLGGIGLIALVIASLGIANALLAAVRERTREIGVLKAIGARDRDVRRVFLLEASVLGFLGGVLGVAAGWGVARGVGTVVNRYLVAEGLSRVQIGAPMWLLVACVVGAVALALVAGTLPAIRAARLPAREAVGEL